MVIDSSAVIALLLAEPEQERFLAALEADPIRLISAASMLEVFIVLRSRFPQKEVLSDVEELAERFQIVPVDLAQLHFAREAFDRFGRGRHPAGLNFGDCFTYALARFSRQPLLCKGADFAHTDLPLVATA